MISYLIAKLKISEYNTKSYSLKTHQIISDHEIHNYNTILKIFNVTKILKGKSLKLTSNLSDLEINPSPIYNFYIIIFVFMMIWFILVVIVKLNEGHKYNYVSA